MTQLSSTDKEISMAELMQTIWSLQDELDNFTHKKRERDLLRQELQALHQERCRRTGDRTLDDIRRDFVEWTKQYVEMP